MRGNWTLCRTVDAAALRDVQLHAPLVDEHWYRLSGLPRQTLLVDSLGIPEHTGYHNVRAAVISKGPLTGIDLSGGRVLLPVPFLEAKTKQFRQK